MGHERRSRAGDTDMVEGRSMTSMKDGDIFDRDSVSETRDAKRLRVESDADAP